MVWVICLFRGLAINNCDLEKIIVKRQNASLISTAIQYGAQGVARFPSLSNISIIHNDRIRGGDEAIWLAAKHFSENKNHYRQMEKLLSSWDLGLSGVEIIEKEVIAENGMAKIWQPYGKHKTHLKEYILPFSNESSGTQAAFFLLALLLSILTEGGVAIIDEFENDLHPHMLEPILDLFASEKTNPHNAQLLFSCHAVEVLNLVHKSQIMLVQKNNDCESTACRLDKIEGIRADDNFYGKYMAGHYGAIPNF